MNRDDLKNSDIVLCDCANYNNAFMIVGIIVSDYTEHHSTKYIKYLYKVNGQTSHDVRWPLVELDDSTWTLKEVLCRSEDIQQLFSEDK